MDRAFTIGQVLTITGEKLLCSVGEVYEICNFLTGDNLFTHQLPRAGRIAKPWVLRQYPELADVDTSAVTPENWREFLAAQEARWGKTLELTPLPSEDWTHINPIEEAAQMMRGSRKNL